MRPSDIFGPVCFLTFAILSFELGVCHSDDTGPSVKGVAPEEAVEIEPEARAKNDYRLLELSWECGRARFRECELTLILPQYSGSAGSNLDCVLNIEEPPPFNVDHQFSPEETEDLWKLVEAADLFGAETIGIDTRAGDGCLTLLVVSKPLATAALVVSGNPSFEVSGPRKDLRDWLFSHHRELWDVWRESKGNQDKGDGRVQP